VGGVCDRSVVHLREARTIGLLFTSYSMFRFWLVRVMESMSRVINSRALYIYTYDDVSGAN
jgi:hypothetical protein